MAKKLLLLLLFLSFCGIAQATSYVDDANCQGAWLFTEGSGTTVDDASANSNTGNFASSGHPAWYSTSLPKAYMTYAVNYTPSDYISIANESNFDFEYNQAFSIVDWHNPNESRVGTYEEHKVFSKLNSGAPYSGFEFLTIYGDLQVPSTSTSNVLKILLVSVFGVSHIEVKGSTDLPNGTWAHIAVTYSGNDDASGVVFYIDGVSDTENIIFNTLGTNSILNNITPYMACRNGANGFSNSKNTELGVFNDVLSSTEINDIMDNGLAPAATGYGQVI